ncbi:MAG TPA: hypothetical protein VI685_16565 [Candidatus Angelobacter sp.]
MLEPDNTLEPQNSETGNAVPDTETPAEEASIQKEDSMDIHPIHGPVLTLREFFVHLLIITLGILIALSLEGLLEWQHHRSLLREARENLAAEVQRNKKILAADMENLRKSETQLHQIVSTVQKLESDPTFKVSELSFGGRFGSLSSTSWNTANRSGAIGYMAYDEVEKYTEVYGQQQELLTVEFQALPSFTELAGLLTTSLAKDRKHMVEPDLRELERRANHALILVGTLEDSAQQLDTGYGKISSQ